LGSRYITIQIINHQLELKELIDPYTLKYVFTHKKMKNLYNNKKIGSGKSSFNLWILNEKT